ncbi:MAG TPA: 2-oxoacid:acceptor oxidoreductase family protein [Candidatus Binatia bacterium]|nr:2-oxoacid:acceptor oxidoreductase family protein [Candidatus Binatia bacterium]
MIRHLRFHGRGGQGVKLAGTIVSRAAFLAGFTVQDSPVYGAERRGAPVVAFVRLSDRPIHERGYIEAPDLVVLLDHSLLAHPEAAVIDGLDEQSLTLVNTAHSAAELKQRYNIPGRVEALDVSSIALDAIGQHVLSAPIAGFATKVAKLASWNILAEAVRGELNAIGVSGELLQRNLIATRRAFEAAPEVAVAERAAAAVLPSLTRFTVPRLPARIAAPWVSGEATSALRHMEGWRVYRPVIDLSRCTRCFLCFALCPEAAIHLDAQNYPGVDYDHCKGCLVCVTECPPQTIHKQREAEL